MLTNMADVPSTTLRLLVVLCVAQVYSAVGELPPTLPPWAPEYSLARSTITMQCNGSGWSSPTRGAAFGIVSYDWSNAKAQWAAAKPMDCEERLLKQAQMTKAAGADHVFVYRNLVKALPWFTSVREKLDDPAYASWFLRFDASKSKSEYHVPACAAENATKCSVFYHDQEQTPEVPTKTQPHPDGSCTDGVCDCGTQPCGEYLWDHRNGSMLRDWLIKEHILGPMGVGSPDIDGLFVDDFWCSDLLCKEKPHQPGCPCGDPVQGPTEIDRNSQADMGLSDNDIRDLTESWNETMTAFQQAMLDAKAYTWSLIAGQSHANASPSIISKASCASTLKYACQATSSWQTQAHLVGVKVNGSTWTQLEQDVAFFLLARGPYAWLGWGVWGMTWPFNPEPAHGELPPLPHGVPRPALFDRDFGTPVDATCHEVTGSAGVFRRQWTKATIELDCNTFTAKLG